MSGSSSPSSRVHAVAGILLDEGRVLLTQRAEGQSFPRMWEFPGGKVEPGESPEEALIREFHEEVGITIAAPVPYDRIHYRGPGGRDITVDFFRVGSFRGVPRALEVAAVAWVALGDLAEVDFIPANELIVRRLTDGLPR